MVEVAYGKNVCPMYAKRYVKQGLLDRGYDFNPRRSVRRNLLDFAEKEGFLERLEAAADKLDDFLRETKGKVGSYCLYLKAGQLAKLCGVPDLE